MREGSKSSVTPVVVESRLLKEGKGGGEHKWACVSPDRRGSSQGLRRGWAGGGSGPTRRDKFSFVGAFPRILAWRDERKGKRGESKEAWALKHTLNLAANSWGIRRKAASGAGGSLLILKVEKGGGTKIRKVV